MEPENQDTLAESPQAGMAAAPPANETAALEPIGLPPQAPEPNPLRWIFMGPKGLRAGWSVMIFIAVFAVLGSALGFLMHKMAPAGSGNDFTPGSALIGEFLEFLVLLCAAWVVSLIERRSVMDYNLIGPRRPFYFFSGLIAGFAALSVLVGALSLGGWLHFGPVALSGPKIFEYAAMWGLAFLFVGFVEEGSMRCFLLSTLTRGLNFWWALGLIGCICLDLVFRAKGNGVWGVYAMALMGIAPCLRLHLKRSSSAGFWQAAWVTSTLFGFIHTGNGGENWIGIFAAAAIGFVFCVSVRVTGSAWWAIGCHAAWDWAETYFYGTADSGFVAKGHLLSATTGGNPLWSGGTDGPEGSLLVIGVILLLLVLLLVLYGGKKKAGPISVPALEQALG
jgi:uncharacterized protein